MAQISPEQFLHAYAKTWRAGADRITLPLGPSDAWTSLMLNHNGFLWRVAEELRKGDETFAYRRELYTVDAVILGGNDLFRTGLCYPSAVHVLIEHELGYYVEEEMWKLLHWRCPLKVLITYDWPEDEKDKSATKRSWLHVKIEKLRCMRDEVEKFQGEEPRTSYLFLIGDRKSSNTPVCHWRYASSRNAFDVRPLLVSDLVTKADRPLAPSV